MTHTNLIDAIIDAATVEAMQALNDQTTPERPRAGRPREIDGARPVQFILGASHREALERYRLSTGLSMSAAVRKLIDTLPGNPK